MIRQMFSILVTNINIFYGNKEVTDYSSVKINVPLLPINSGWRLERHFGCQFYYCSPSHTHSCSNLTCKSPFQLNSLQIDVKGFDFRGQLDFWSLNPHNIPHFVEASATVVSVFPDSWGRPAGMKGGRVSSFLLAFGPFKADYMELALP